MELLKHYESNPPKRCTIVAPMVNQWGVEQVFRGDHARRKDEFSTDLNRNWFWPPDSNKCGHHYEKSPDYYREWSGPHPVSEPGSKFLVYLYETYAVRVLANIHSGIFSLYTGWDAHWDRPIPNKDRHEAKLQRIRENHMCPKCGNDIGQASDIDDFQAYCTTNDAALAHGWVEEAYTLEIYGDLRERDILKSFNPESKGGFNEVMRVWVPIIVDVLFGN